MDRPASDVTPPLELDVTPPLELEASTPVVAPPFSPALELPHETRRIPAQIVLLMADQDRRKRPGEDSRLRKAPISCLK